MIKQSALEVTHWAREAAYYDLKKEELLEKDR